jgi:putative oxidoreductase
VHLSSGFFWDKGGYEYPILWGLIGLALALRGSGELLVERKLAGAF